MDSRIFQSYFFSHFQWRQYAVALPVPTVCVMIRCFTFNYACMLGVKIIADLANWLNVCIIKCCLPLSPCFSRFQHRIRYYIRKEKIEYAGGWVSTLELLSITNQMSSMVKTRWYPAVNCQAHGYLTDPVLCHCHSILLLPGVPCIISQPHIVTKIYVCN